MKFSFLGKTIKSNFLTAAKILLVSEKAEWVIKEIAEELVREVNKRQPNSAALTYEVWGLRNKILHFTSINTIVEGTKIKKIHPSNKVIVTWYHILENDPRLSLIPELVKMVELFHTVCSTTTALLQKAGVPAEKIVVIPESIDLNIFKNYSLEEKNKIKQKLTLPQDKVIIGSFQKDGSGWGEGLKPKLEKGPDIFCDVVEKIAAEMPIHILLTGPARGYVKHRLDRAGIPYTHHFLQNFREIVEYYNALDLYLVTSRQEGGPKAILESMACGIPFVTTEVGMAPDIVKDRVNGRIVEVEDTLALTDAAIQIIHNVDDAQTMIEHGLRDVKSFATSVIIDRYMKELYSNVGFSKT